MNGWVIWWAALFTLEIVTGVRTSADAMFATFEAFMCALSWEKRR
jgi:hypothetical protein